MKEKKRVIAEGLDEAFNISYEENDRDLYMVDGHIPLVVDECIDEAIDENENQVIGDSDFIRTELKSNIDTAKKALARALEIQEEDEKARNTEVISDLIDTINRCLSQLINLNKIEADINFKKEKLDNNEDSPTTTNNILVTGNTSDILKQLAIEMKKS